MWGVAGLMSLKPAAGHAAYGLVQRVLGHKQLDTTIRFYTGLETPQALAYFQRLVVERSGQLIPPFEKAGFRA
jgi:hypothetical protein